MMPPNANAFPVVEPIAYVHTIVQTIPIDHFAPEDGTGRVSNTFGSCKESDFLQPNPPELEPVPIADTLSPLIPLPYEEKAVSQNMEMIDDNSMSVLLQGLFTNSEAISNLTSQAEADMEWLFDSNDQDSPSGRKTWHQFYNEMVAFKKSHGHCNVSPLNHFDTDLVEWTKNQRHHYRLIESSRPSPMTTEQVELLNKIDFVWNAYCAAWDERFEELIEYRQKTGHCNVPKVYRPNQQLSTWVKRQRRQYRAKSLNHTRIERLESIGFVWDIVQHREQRRKSVIGSYRAQRQNGVVSTDGSATSSTNSVDIR